jgi:hypothetical protein
VFAAFEPIDRHIRLIRLSTHRMILTRLITSDDFLKWA